TQAKLDLQEYIGSKKEAKVQGLESLERPYGLRSFKKIKMDTNNTNQNLNKYSTTARKLDEKNVNTDEGNKEKFPLRNEMNSELNTASPQMDGSSNTKKMISENSGAIIIEVAGTIAQSSSHDPRDKIDVQDLINDLNNKDLQVNYTEQAGQELQEKASVMEIHMLNKEGRNEDEVTQSEEKDNTEEELMSQLGESDLDEIIATEKDMEENQDNEKIKTRPNTLIEQEQEATIGEVAVPMDEDGFETVTHKKKKKIKKHSS
ncbi:8210_t:CDS:2, partial [Gigaspora margarita]